MLKKDVHFFFLQKRAELILFLDVTEEHYLNFGPNKVPIS